MTPRVAQVLIPVSNLTDALVFYTDGLGLRVKFRDGDRFAALDGGTVTLALVSETEDVTDGRVSVAFEVDGAERHLQELAEKGGTIHTPVAQGPHEIRGVVADSDGNLLTVYSKLA